MEDRLTSAILTFLLDAFLETPVGQSKQSNRTF